MATQPIQVPASEPTILFFDTETTGLPLWKDPSDDPGQPHIVEIACELWSGGAQIDAFHAIVNNGVPIPDDLAALHGITTEIAAEKGIPPLEMINAFMALVDRADLLVGHNVSFDVRMMRIQCARLLGDKWDCPIETYCTMRWSTGHCQIPADKPRHAKHWKWPRLSEAISHFFGEELPDAHSAKADCEAARRVYFHLQTLEN